MAIAPFYLQIDPLICYVDYRCEDEFKKKRLRIPDATIFLLTTSRQDLRFYGLHWGYPPYTFFLLSMRTEPSNPGAIGIVSITCDV
jgi:hypothetical protein